MDGTFAAVAITLYAAHHVGDYWIQTDHQARYKGQAGHAGRMACLMHVLTYLSTQYVMVGIAVAVLDLDVSVWGPEVGVLVSGVTHYMADRREHGLMFRLVQVMPGKRDFLRFGQGERTVATGAWALDQAWHIFWGVWVFALLLVVLP